MRDNERFEMTIDDKGMVTEIRHGYEMDVGSDPKAVVNQMTDNAESKKPREFLLIKNKVLEKDFDAFEVFPESQCDPKDLKAEKILGQIRTIEKSAFDELQKERDQALAEVKEINRHLSAKHLDLLDMIKERDELKVQLEATQLQSYYRGQTSLESMKVIEELKAENERLKKENAILKAYKKGFHDKALAIQTHADQLAKFIENSQCDYYLGETATGIHRLHSDDCRRCAELAAWAKFREGK